MEMIFAVGIRCVDLNCAIDRIQNVDENAI